LSDNIKTYCLSKILAIQRAISERNQIVLFWNLFVFFWKEETIGLIENEGTFQKHIRIAPDRFGSWIGKGKGVCLIVKQERYVGWKTTIERHLDNS
jgi:hypothetical protein